jgi:hypothetical protein
MHVNLTITNFISQGLKTPASQLKSSKEDSVTCTKFNSSVHFNGLALKLWGFEPLAVDAEDRGPATALALT